MSSFQETAIREAMPTTFLRHLNALDAFRETRAWVATQPDAATAWATCPRPDWMAWLLVELHARGSLSRQTLVLAACACAETALHHVPAGEDRPRLAIETARRWARGEATVEEVRAAADAADAAAKDAYYADAADAYFSSRAAAAAARADACNAAYYAAAADASTAAHTPAADAVRGAVPWKVVEAALCRVGESSP